LSPPPLASEHVDSRGPLISAVVAAAASCAPLAAVLAGIALTLRMVLILLAPALAISATAVAVSMGWIFLLVGRQHRRPTRLGWTIALLALAILAMLTLILLMLRTQATA
jgi:hypothetical protein